MLVRWEDSYLVGNEQIDQEHRYLFELINQFYDAFSENHERNLVITLLNRLVDYAQRHFTNEEAIMRASGYVALEQHQEHHEQLFDQVFELNTKLANRSYNPTHETVRFLKTWLTDHIVHEDLLFAAYLKDKKTGKANSAS